jgi:hypothetical protein
VVRVAGRYGSAEIKELESIIKPADASRIDTRQIHAHAFDGVTFLVRKPDATVIEILSARKYPVPMALSPLS